MRNLASVELFQNQAFYASHPYIEEKSHFFHHENTAFSASVSDAALADGYDRNNPSSRTIVVKREAIKNATSGTYASLMCMLALSSVTGMNILSVYPEEIEKETKSSQLLNGTICPRTPHKLFASKLAQPAKLIILWSRDGINILPGVSNTFQPNHFVPLLEYNHKGKSHHGGLSRAHQSKIGKAIQPSITELFQREKDGKGIQNTFRGKDFA